MTKYDKECAIVGLKRFQVVIWNFDKYYFKKVIDIIIMQEGVLLI